MPDFEYPKIYKADNTKFSVLIVDDSLFMRIQLIEIFNAIDCNIIGEAEDGKQCVEMVANLQPDLITLDLTMPEMDGLQAMEELKKRQIPAKIIVISALGQKEKVLSCIKLGALEYIVKPFEDKDVAVKIHNVLKRISI